MNSNDITLNDLLYGPQGEYGHLFPYRDRVPKINKHIFTDLLQSKMPLDEAVLQKMLDIDYIGWTAKVILGIDLFPIQMAMLQTMWNTPFPMLIACRGGSKCIRGDSLCRTSEGLLMIDEIVDPKSPTMTKVPIDYSMEGENGYRDPAYGWNNGVSQTKKITLRSGIEIEATYNHPIRCLDSEGCIVWRDADQIEPGDIVPIDRDQYDFGNDATTSQDLGWWLGLIMGDSMFPQRDCIFDMLNELYQEVNSNSYAQEIPKLIRQSPRNVVSAFIRGLFDVDSCIEKDSARISYASCSETLVRQVQQVLLGFGIVSVLKTNVTKSQNGADAQSYQLLINGEYNIALYAKHIGFVHIEKKDILQNHVIKITNHNYDSIPNVLHIMIRLQAKFIEYTNGENENGCELKNTSVLSECIEPGCSLSYDKLVKFLDMTQCLCDDQDWKNLKELHRNNYYYDHVDHIEDSSCQTFDVHIPDDHSFISNGIISHNSFMLAVYAVLRALLDPGTKIVIVGAGLRQARLVFNYIDTMWSNSPVLRSIIGGGNKAGPKQNVDLCYFKLGDSIVYALPTGDGCSDTLTCVTHKDGFGRISDGHENSQTDKTVINRYDQIWGNGKFRSSDESYCNGMSKTKKIKTRKGFKFNATYNHRLKVVRDQHILWARMDEMEVGDRILLDRSIRWHNGNCGVSQDEAYALGVLIGDGSFVSQYYIGFATKDVELSEAVQIIGNFKQQSDIVHYKMQGWAERLDVLKEFGIDRDHLKTKDKRFPSTILKSSREVTSAFISGLFDSDGTVSARTERGGTTICVTFYNTSKELVRQLQYILLHYGIVAHIASRKRSEKWEECYELSITGRDVLIFATEIGFRLKRKQDKLLDGIDRKKRWMDQGDSIPNILEDMIDISENNLAPRGTGNCVSVCAGRLKVKKSVSRPLVENFLRVYGHLDDPRIASIRCLADPDIYYDEIVSIEDSECVTFDVHVPDGHEYCANGFNSHNTKIRGFRANVVLADEFACLDKDTLIETENGLERISDIDDIDTRIINRYGELESIERFVETPKTDVYEIVTKYGYRFKCSNRHKVLTSDGWKLGKDLNSNDFLVMRNSYIFPDKAYDEFITEDMAWLMGQLVSEGTVTSKYYVGIKTTDVRIVDKILNKFGYLNPKVYAIDAYIDSRGWSCKKSYSIQIHSKEFRDKLSELGISYVRADKKCIPNSILKSSKNIVVSFLRGLFEGDGSCFSWKDRGKTRLGVAYYTVSDALAQDVQTLLLKLDIIIARRTRTSKISERKQWILRANGKHALDLTKLLDIQKWQSIITSTTTHIKAETYGVTFDKSRDKWKVSILHCGKVNNLGRYDNKTDALQISREFLDDNDDHLQVQSVTKLVDQDHLYDFHLPLTHSFYGNGFIQHNSIPEDVFDIVVRGFAATSKTPMEEAKKIAFDKTLARLDVPGDIKNQLAHDNKTMHGNQIVYSGTAYYAFNHFAKKYEMWLDIIKSKGDADKIAQIFGGENLVPDGFNYKDYSIIRLPHTHLPAGLLDQRQLAHAKATLPRNIYLMEYGACASKELMVHTDIGTKQIVDVNIGDNVLSHTGQYRQVTAKKYRHYRGNMINLRIGSDTNIHVTPDHLFWDGDTFIGADKLDVGSILCIPKPELRDHHVFDLTDYCNNYREPSMSTHNDVSVKNNTSTKYYRRGQKFKSSIPMLVDASYDLGLILGSYAANGSIRDNGQQIEISFNIAQRDRAGKFADAVRNVFGLESHFLNRYCDNTLRVTVNSRMLCQFVKQIIGCGASIKQVLNVRQFTKSMACGFIAGYWMGDGSITKYTIFATSASRQLLEDVRFLLLATGCYGGITQKILHKCYIRDKSYNVKPAWSLCVPANYRKIFINIIGNDPSTARIFVPIRDKSIFDYDDYVYNLEVEEDHSYFAGGAISHNCFVKDSDGFFPRSLIEGCTVGPNKPIQTPDGDVTFTPLMKGVKGPIYVVGIDPAAERDNLAVVVVEVRHNHYRIVYCWTVNKKEFIKRKKRGLVVDDDYYAYCCSRIRNIVDIFNPVRIEMDSQGGGYAVAEMLRNKKMFDMTKGDFPIYETIDFDDPRSTDGETDGRHILHLVKQTSDFNQEANICLHKSLETRTLLFPAFDSVKMYAAIEIEKSMGVLFDTYEENVFNIEELKNELCTIQMSETATGKEKFDTPHVVQAGGVEGRTRKGRLRKDRYTALLLCHKYIYETSISNDDGIDYNDIAGNIVSSKNKQTDEPLYRGPGVGRMRNSEQSRTGGTYRALKGGKKI